jgi:hypothetical protein
MSQAKVVTFDVYLERENVLIMFRTNDPQVDLWFTQNTHAPKMGNGYAVGQHYAPSILQALQEEGFTVGFA